MTSLPAACRTHHAGSWKGVGVSVLRVLLFAAVVILIHDQHRRRMLSIDQNVLTPPPLAAVQRLLPAAALLSVSSGMGGSFEVQDAQGQPLGLAIQTSPVADDIIGFSGPTNVLIAFGTEERITGVSILASRDTREHVAQVEGDPRFLQSWNGLSWEGAGHIDRLDAVSGATLTSLAVAESIAARLGGVRTSLRFPEPLSVESARVLFPQAEQVVPHPQWAGYWTVRDASGQSIGFVLRTTPAADNHIGYQGPTDAHIGLDAQGGIVGLEIGRSYDNEPYVDYVREEASFLRLFNGRTLAELAALDASAPGVEGVSGATMTSQAVAEGVVLAAQAHQRSMQAAAQAAAQRSQSHLLSMRDVGTILITLLGVVIGLTSLRGRRFVRIGFQLAVIGYLGFVNGDMVSQALLVGWAQNGVPWRTVLGPVVLSIAAFVVPMTTKHNVYCTQLCPHGALQQLVRNRLPWQWHVPRPVRRVLTCVPGLLLLWVVIVALGAWSFSLVNLEPFDAYLYPIAGWATLTIALIGLVASLFVPMAYCRYGCPTGALLNYVRRQGHPRLSGRDALAVLCLCIAAGLWWFAG